MAPEVMCRQNHTTSVDYFAVGIMAYECIFGRVSKLVISVTIKSNNYLAVYLIASVRGQEQEGDP